MAVLSCGASVGDTLRMLHGQVSYFVSLRSDAVGLAKGQVWAQPANILYRDAISKR